jgi:hypothetical protein
MSCLQVKCDILASPLLPSHLPLGPKYGGLDSAIGESPQREGINI